MTAWSDSNKAIVRGNKYAFSNTLVKKSVQGITIEKGKIGVLHTWENGKDQPESLKCLQRGAELSSEDKTPREESMVWGLQQTTSLRMHQELGTVIIVLQMGADVRIEQEKWRKEDYDETSRGSGRNGASS